MSAGGGSTTRGQQPQPNGTYAVQVQGIVDKASAKIARLENRMQDLAREDADLVKQEARDWEAAMVAPATQARVAHVAAVAVSDTLELIRHQAEDFSLGEPLELPTANVLVQEARARTTPYLLMQDPAFFIDSIQRIAARIVIRVDKLLNAELQQIQTNARLRKAKLRLWKDKMLTLRNETLYHRRRNACDTYFTDLESRLKTLTITKQFDWNIPSVFLMRNSRFRIKKTQSNDQDSQLDPHDAPSPPPSSQVPAPTTRDVPAASACEPHGRRPSDSHPPVFQSDSSLQDPHQFSLRQPQQDAYDPLYDRYLPPW
ncbi:hypothetical protein JCM10908_006637 [Rhodotorula pacifica]|uniref:uncharacterized protein n=1 Tax=Rhodotorula pacifica TaxID=1495444 RepID=UPI00317A0368